MVARMLQYLYHGRYDVINIAEDLSHVLDNASSTIILDNSILAQDYDFEVHAQVYAMAGRFGVSSLKVVSAANFVSELRSQNFSITDLSSAIDIVYTTTPEHDIGLRKWVVYRAQRLQHRVVRDDRFQDLLKRNTDFALDYATKYARANYLWCSHCKDTVELVECKCGFYGMCGDSLCAKEAVAALHCSGCNKVGNIQHEMPALEDGTTLGALPRMDVPNTGIRGSGKKRRRSS